MSVYRPGIARGLVEDLTQLVNKEHDERLGREWTRIQRAQENLMRTQFSGGALVEITQIGRCEDRESLREKKREEVDDRETRETILSTTTWDEVMRQLQRLLAVAGEMENGDLSVSDLMGLRLFPLQQKLLSGTTSYEAIARSIGDGLGKHMLQAPFYTQRLELYRQIEKQLSTVANQHRSEASSYAAGSEKIQTETAVVVSEWFQEFLYVFDQARQINDSLQGEYPKGLYSPLNKLVAIFSSVPVLKEVGKRTDFVERTVATFATDVNYQLSRFCSLAGRLPFVLKPIFRRDVIDPPYDYSDVQLLLHFALECVDASPAAADLLSEFLTRPRSFFHGNESSHRMRKLVDAVTEAVILLRDTWDESARFNVSKDDSPFRALSGGVKVGTLLKKRNKIGVPVPVMRALIGSVIDDLSSLKMTPGMERVVRTVRNTDRRYLSPISHMLNFHTEAYDDFVRLRNVTEARTNTTCIAAAAMMLEISELDSVLSLYRALLSAAGVVVALSHLLCPDVADDRRQVRDGVVYLLQACVAVENHGVQKVLYASSLEQFPGLLFYTLLGFPERKTRDQHTGDQHRVNSHMGNIAKVALPQVWTDASFKPTSDSPPICRPEFFTGNPGAVALFDAFGQYMERMPGMQLSQSQLVDFDVEKIEAAKRSGHGNLQRLIERSGVRDFTAQDRSLMMTVDQVRTPIKTIQCAYLNSLYGTVLKSGWTANNKLIEYFTRDIPSTEKDQTLWSTDGKKGGDLLSFLLLPVRFFIEGMIVNKSKRKEPKPTVVKKDGPSLGETIGAFMMEALDNKKFQ